MGRHRQGERKKILSLPKDRDQAFYINRGVLPHLVQWPWLVPQLEGFKAKTKNIRRFNFAACNLDRFFLNSWISPLRRLVLTFTYTASKEDKLPLISLGWKF